MKCKGTVFIDEIRAKSSYLESRGRKKAFINPFEERKDFFSILNSFENISRREKCVSRNLPNPETFDIK